MAPNLTHSIFDPLSCTGTQWIVDKVMIEHSLHSVLICDIHTARFPLDCSRAAFCPCTLFRVRCRPHSEGCEGNITIFLHHMTLYSSRSWTRFWLPMPSTTTATRTSNSWMSAPAATSISKHCRQRLSHSSAEMTGPAIGFCLLPWPYE